MEPSLFRMNVSTGAPPDFFGPEGQNWGFPTYCWEEMAKDGYRWWRRRLQQLSQCALLMFRDECHTHGCSSAPPASLSSMRKTRCMRHHKARLRFERRQQSCDGDERRSKNAPFSCHVTQPT